MLKQRYVVVLKYKNMKVFVMYTTDTLFINRLSCFDNIIMPDGGTLTIEVKKAKRYSRSIYCGILEYLPVLNYCIKNKTNIYKEEI